MEPPADSIAMADEPGDAGEPGDVTEPESSDALCAAIDEQLSDMVEDPLTIDSDSVLERLPEDLRSELEALGAEADVEAEVAIAENGWSEYYGGAKRSQLAEEIDAYTLDNCGVPYLRATMHTLVACHPILRQIDNECADPRDDLENIKTLEQSEREYREYLDSFRILDDEDLKFSEIGSAIS